MSKLLLPRTKKGGKGRGRFFFEKQNRFCAVKDGACLGD